MQKFRVKLIDLFAFGFWLYTSIGLFLYVQSFSVYIFLETENLK